jgi:hypothetical protein
MTPTIIGSMVVITTSPSTMMSMITMIVISSSTRWCAL